MEGETMKDFLNNLLKHKPIIFIDNLIFRISDDKVFALGAQLSYFLILSLFPFLIVLLNIISYTSLVDVDVVNDTIKYLPIDIQLIITGFIDDLVYSSSQSLLSIAAIAGLWTASSGLTPVIRAINKAYDYEETRSYFKLKFISIVFTIALLALLLLVIITLVFGEVLGKKVFDFFGMEDLFLTIWNFIRFIAPILFMIYIFALLYKFSPCVEKRKNIRLKNTLPGAIFTTIGWIITSSGFSYYVSNFGKYSTTYGSVGGVIVLLVWLYISSIIIILGGEVNAAIEFFRLNGLRVISNHSVISRAIEKYT